MMSMRPGKIHRPSGLLRPMAGRWGCACLLAAVALVATPARAEPAALWGFVDGTGTAHVATTKRDSRYRLLLGGSDNMPARVLGKTDRTAGLLTWLEIAPAVRVLQPVLRDAARDEGVDIELLQAIIVVESGYNGRAVSPRGAVGLMQITPETADRYATPADLKRPAAERLLDARNNVRTGARMLSDLTRRFRSIDLALAAWNAGEGAVRKAGGRMPEIDETRAHVQLVLELYWALLQDHQTRLATTMEIHND